jgi:hypothetical protein
MKRWLKRLALAAAAAALLAALAALGWGVATRRTGRAHLHEVTAALDAADPGWRLEDILAARNASFPPDDLNAMKVTEAVRAAATRTFDDWSLRCSGNTGNGRQWLPEYELNRRPRPEDAADARCARDATRPAIDVARRLRLLDRPGGIPLAVPADPMATLLPFTQNVRHTAAVLNLDTIVAADEGDPDQGIASAHACLNATLAIGDEPTLISMLVRVAVGAIAKTSAERVLALGEPTKGLAELQAAFLAEADAPRLRDGFRGERAFLNRLFENVENGSLPLAQIFTAVGNLATASGGTGGGLMEFVQTVRYRQHVPGDHAAALDMLTRYVEAAKLPPHVARKRMKAVEPPPNELRYTLTRALTPAIERVGEADWRARAYLRSAACGLACERFRQRHGRWPRALDDLVPEYLPGGVPLDPYTGVPLRYAVYPGGAVVYATGPDEHDDGGNVDARATAGTDLGFRLWDPDRRGAAPLPPTPEELAQTPGGGP